MEYITIAEASQLVDKHKDTIRSWLKNNKVETAKDNKGRIIFSKEALLKHYNATEQAKLPQSRENIKDDEIPNYDEKTPEKASQSLKNDENGAMDKIIGGLLKELDEKNRIILEQQKTIQQVVDQQQKLSGMLLTATTKQVGTVEEQSNFEAEDDEEYIIEEDEALDPPKKKHWWNRK